MFTTFWFALGPWIPALVYLSSFIVRVATIAEAVVSARGTSAPRAYNRWWVYLLLLALHFGLGQALPRQQFAVRPFSIPSGSMMPTIVPGDFVMADMNFYRARTPRNGDIIIFPASDRTGMSIVCRVVAGPEQTVSVSDGQLLVDGQVQKYGEEEPTGSYDGQPVPTESYFVMGDNINNARDSRFIGPIHISQIQGKVRAVVWPLNRISSFDSN